MEQFYYGTTSEDYNFVEVDDKTCSKIILKLREKESITLCKYYQYKPPLWVNGQIVIRIKHEHILARNREVVSVEGYNDKKEYKYFVKEKFLKE